MKSLKTLALAVAAATILGATACAPSTSPGSTESGAPGDSDAPSVVLSNSFIGNAWRKTMVEGVQAAADQALADGRISSFEVINANGEASEQISQIQAIILKQPDVLLVDPASPTALNGVIDQAVAAGIRVVSFDGNVETDSAYNLAPDWVGIGEKTAQSVVDNIGGKGNVLGVRGVAGTTIDDGQYQGWLNVLEKNPDVDLVGEVVGDWDQATAQTAVSSALSTLPDIDGVFVAGGSYGTAQAFEAAGRDIPVIYGGGEGVFLKWWQDQVAKDPSYVTESDSSGPSIGTAAFWIGVLLTEGVEFPKAMPYRTLTITNDNLDEWVEATPLDGIAQEEWNEEKVREVFAE